MKRAIIIAAAIAFLSSLPLHAQLQAVVSEVTGKVEVKPQGGTWKPATVKMTLAQGATISTGFNSRVVLAIGESRITVSPLTRLSLEEIVKKDAVNSASMSLKVGKVNASVKSAAGEKSAFTVKGPVSTAAVRGTEFMYNGYVLEVTEGTVSFTNLVGQQASVGAGSGSATDGYTTPQTGEEFVAQTVEVPPAETGGLPGGASDGGGGTSPTLPLGTIQIIIQ